MHWPAAWPTAGVAGGQGEQTFESADTPSLLAAATRDSFMASEPV
jgi:hypothetical protein